MRIPLFDVRYESCQYFSGDGQDAEAESVSRRLRGGDSDNTDTAAVAIVGCRETGSYGGISSRFIRCPWSEAALRADRKQDEVLPGITGTRYFYQGLWDAQEITLT